VVRRVATNNNAPLHIHNLQHCISLGTYDDNASIADESKRRIGRWV
jgi:hypothetical protein